MDGCGYFREMPYVRPRSLLFWNAVRVYLSKSTGLKQCLGEFRLANDTQQSAPPYGVVERDRNSDCCSIDALLHDPVATTLAGYNESVLFENLAYLRTRKNPEITQPVPQPGSRTLHSGTVEKPRKGKPSRRKA